MTAAQPATDGSILATILQEAHIAPGDESFALALTGVTALIGGLIDEGADEPRADRAAVDGMIAEIDRRLSRQLDAILHHERFQRLEAAWRSLQLLVDRSDTRENIRIALLNASREDLLTDFEDAPDLTRSGLYKLVYAAEYGQFGGEPYAAIVADYAFTPGAQDISLLQRLGAIAAQAHAPVLAAAAPAFFGVDSFRRLPALNDLKSLFDGPQYAKWRSFRGSEEARNVGLTVPRMLLRLPYGPDTVPVKAFDYVEDVSASHESYLWGSCAFALATRLTASFASHRWCPNIIGPQSGGTVGDLPLHQYRSQGGIATTCPTETLISERREYELAEQGFIALAMRKGSDNACFFSANSCQEPATFGTSPEGRAAEANSRLGAQLPYLFVVNRLAHYIKVLQREQIGSWKDRAVLQDELQRWIGQYVSDMENPAPAVRDARPLRMARITVDEIPGEVGWFRVGLHVVPHLKYQGASFTLSLVGKLDRT